MRSWHARSRKSGWIVSPGSASLGLADYSLVDMLGPRYKSVGFVFKAHRLLYHSTLGLRVIKKKKNPSTLELKKDPREVLARAVEKRRGVRLVARCAEKLAWKIV